MGNCGMFFVHYQRKTIQFDASRRRLTQSFFKSGRSRQGGNDRHLKLTPSATNRTFSVTSDLAQVFFRSCI